MRTRAYRPEVCGCLEYRSLLSGFAGLTADPVVLLNRQLTVVTDHFRTDFRIFARDRVDSDLREELRNVAVIIPFGRVDGLGVTINRIVDRMEQELSANVPHAIRLALLDVIAATRAEVQARVQAGDVIVR